MNALRSTWAVAVVLSGCAATATAQDPRLRDVAYDPDAVVTVPVKRGVVTLVVLGADESIAEVASGLGADCAKADAAWCVATHPGNRTLFVKPKSTASAANNLAVVTDRRIHNLRFVVLPDADPKPAVYRLTIRPPVERSTVRGPDQHVAQLPPLPPLPPLPVLPVVSLASSEQLVAERLQAKPRVLNTQYSLAEGRDSQDIVPSLVFDDGRFTYLRFPGNREVPAVFHVLGDGSETLVNARMEDDALVIDRVSRRLMLRAGSAVVGIWNEAFDLEGVPAVEGTTVPGVQRILKPDAAVAARAPRGATP
ncbi:MAG: TrbG/VirB9 family P-type conjugative transfer protein [Burkholderiales bacterium]|nr:TrbG/VirB9 family P-type conjugative transfer protein [Burkholderiales bacterium]